MFTSVLYVALEKKHLLNEIVKSDRITSQHFVYVQH